MKFEDLEKAEEIRQQIEKLETFITYKRSPFVDFIMTRKRNNFSLSLVKQYIFSEQSTVITSEILSDAIKKALEQVVEDLKGQLAELGVEVEEVEI